MATAGKVGHLGGVTDSKPTCLTEIWDRWKYKNYGRLKVGNEGDGNGHKYRVYLKVSSGPTNKMCV